MSLEINPYEVLGVERDANEETIKKAYRRLAKKWHPDTYKGTDKEYAECKFKEINEAGEILLNQERRAKYDLEHPLSVNVYEYYAKKQEPTKPKTKAPKDIEKEKQRRAVLDFLKVEYEHKGEILDMFLELATGAVDDTYSEEEYKEMLELLLAEQMDCITKIQEIIRVARKKQIKGLEVAFGKAEKVIEELTQVGENTPKSLKEAKYKEETRILKEKIDGLTSNLGDRIKLVESFDILEKTWEFQNDNQLKSALKQHNKSVKELLSDIEWIEKTATERNIEDGLIKIYGQEFTIDTCKQRVEKCNLISNLNLQELRKRFWKERCKFSTNSMGGKVLERVYSEDSKGKFVCPPGISDIESNAFYWLCNVESISIPTKLVKENEKIRVQHGSLKELIFVFGPRSQIVDVSKINPEIITKKGDYICICNQERTVGPFALISENSVYLYDDEKMCELNGVKSKDELVNSCNLWGDSECNWKDYQLQIHAWAQVTKRLPEPSLMMLLPTETEAIKEWINLDKTNLNKTLLENDKSRVIKLYIALGALNSKECHAQAEWLISKLDVRKMYRSRLERYPKENEGSPNPIFSVPKSAVDLVEANINNEKFLPYVFAFLEGHRMFFSEAKKAGVDLSPEFIIATAPQYIFHSKAYKITDFEKQLLEAERNIDVKSADRIFILHNLFKKNLEKGYGKNIIETVDSYNCGVLDYKYRYLNLEKLSTYRKLYRFFKRSTKREFIPVCAIEVENAFLSNNSHCLELVNNNDGKSTIVILNLLEEGELFADIITCENENIYVLQAIRRALIDQRKCNNKITGTSIGMNEAPRTTRYNRWHEVVKASDLKWAKEVKWIKFEYLFKSKILGESYKGYRTRFMVEGKAQSLDSPNPYEKQRTLRYYWI